MNRSNKRKRYTGTFSTKSKFGGRPPKFLQSKDEEEIDKFSSSESENEISMQSLQNNKEKRTEEVADDIQEDGTERIVWSTDDSDSDHEKNHEVEEFKESVLATKHLKHDISIGEYNSDEEMISQVESEPTPLQQADEVNINDIAAEVIYDSKDETANISTDLSPPILVKPTVRSERNTDFLIASQTNDVVNDVINKEEEDERADSAKKMKRCVKGGIVERLNKLLLREKSDQAFWRHSLKSNPKVETTISLQVLSLSSLYSLTSMHCKMTAGNINMYILLPCHMVNKMKIQSNHKLNIYPPWKRMFNKELRCVVLICAYHVEVVNESNKKLTKAEQDLLQYHEKQISVCTESNLLLLSDNNTGTTLFETTSCNEPVNSTDNCSSIVQAIENNTYSGKITFTAILQRVICKLCKKENIQSCLQKQLNPEETEVVYSFLVQDSVGMLSEIYLKNSSKSWKELIYTGEGNIIVFRNLRLIKRLSHNKNACYKSMVHQFIPSKEKLIAVSSQLEDSGEVEENVFNVSHCSYIFNADFQSTFKTAESANLKKFTYEYSVPTIDTEGSLIDSYNEKRLSLHIQLIAITDLEQDSDLRSSTKADTIFYVLNINGKELNYIKVRKLWKCYIPDKVFAIISNEQSVSTILLYFKDIRIYEWELVLDEYSTISLLSHAKIPQRDTLTSKELDEIQAVKHAKIPSLNINTREGDLVSVQGIICGINEETALFWNVCNICSSDNVVKDDEQRLWCNVCMKATTIELKMQLDIFVYVDNLSQCSIMCSLLESTIRQYLPSPNHSDFEGFDLSCILQKNFGTALCEVKIIEERKFHVQELRKYCKIKSS